jgi:hypothetical protein
VNNQFTVLHGAGSAESDRLVPANAIGSCTLAEFIYSKAEANWFLLDLIEHNQSVSLASACSLSRVTAADATAVACRIVRSPDHGEKIMSWIILICCDAGHHGYD